MLERRISPIVAAGPFPIVEIAVRLDRDGHGASEIGGSRVTDDVDWAVVGFGGLRDF
jgi:hypothetical protein